MAQNTDEISVLAFAGSIRENSYNKALLRACEELAPEEMAFRYTGLADIPLYNQDIDTEEDRPQPVNDFKKLIGEADLLLISVPEYNYGVTGVLKNAIDWASRPQNGSPSPLDEKPVGIVGASPAVTGTARGQSQLRQAFDYTNSYCMPQPEVLVFQAPDKFDDNLKLTDDKTREFLEEFMKSLREWYREFE